MSQTIQITTELPSDVHILNDDQFDQAMNSLEGKTWSMSDLREWTGKKSPKWLKDNILESTRYRSDINKMLSEGTIVKKPGGGNAWKFKASVMAKWLDKHWEELPW
ncbi:hypothetical protein AYR55_03715 [Loigolactobacillus backii]|uniref:DUF771 domain-containing protein n=1 Tax=Loigolactobacillus backii TaxID=375175 RepID=UPI0007F04D84|nr:DUF771 domain-containing protein [Loigolactobacillus backii]ANK66889.1 hypothetical protein AYR55_03715 [Loigolactobacillus backii]